MSTLPTPRTDAITQADANGHWAIVPADFARQLERELAEAKAERDALKRELFEEKAMTVALGALAKDKDDDRIFFRSEATRWRALAEELAGALAVFANLDVEHMVNQRKPHAHPVFGLNSTLFVLGDVLNARQVLSSYRDAANPASARTPPGTNERSGDECA